MEFLLAICGKITKASFASADFAFVTTDRSLSESES